ncbi:MAG: hypothetical protein H6733_15360 [Alphaproteobacteria bacterium]|nr:hypothetical protein [Alphaproteobacteria bacterium]
MWCALGIGIGTLLVLACVVEAVRGRHVAAWAAAVGPLVMLVAVRQTFSDLAPGASADDLAQRVASMAPVGLVYAGVGAVAWLGGVLPAVRGRGAPALAQAGALMVAAGLVWTPWASGEAVLWSASTASADAVLALRQVAGARLTEAVQLAVVLLFVLGVPVVAWGWVQRRWMGMGETVAAGVLVALTLNTGQPARRAVEAAYGAWAANCPSLATVDPSVPYDRHPVVRARSCASGRARGPDASHTTRPAPSGGVPGDGR